MCNRVIGGSCHTYGRVYNRHVICHHSCNTPADDPAYKQWALDLWKYTAWTPEELVFVLSHRIICRLYVCSTHNYHPYI